MSTLALSLCGKWILSGCHKIMSISKVSTAWDSNHSHMRHTNHTNILFNDIQDVMNHWREGTSPSVARKDTSFLSSRSLYTGIDLNLDLISCLLFNQHVLLKWGTGKFQSCNSLSILFGKQHLIQPLQIQLKPQYFTALWSYFADIYIYIYIHIYIYK